MAIAFDQDHFENIDLTTPEARAGMAKMIMRLFQHWGIPTADQLNLLGLSDKSRALLTKYKKGNAFTANRDVLDRVGWLFAIHKALRLLYPRNKELLYGWVKLRNTAFDNLTPLDVMKEQGIIGVYRVARYLDFVRGR